MDMIINPQKIKTLRQNQAWSQSHLAEVSGLSLRTIQRIESNGKASLESVKALAAVFQTPINELQSLADEKSKQKSKGSFVSGLLLKLDSFKRKVSIIFAAICVLLSSLILLPVSAETILLDAVISQKNTSLSKVQLVNAEGEAAEIRLEGQLKVILTLQQVNNEQIKINSKIYDLSGAEETLIASPELLTANKKEAQIRFGAYALSLTPHLNSAGQ